MRPLITACQVVGVRSPVHHASKGINAANQASVVSVSSEAIRECPMTRGISKNRTAAMTAVSVPYFLPVHITSNITVTANAPDDASRAAGTFTIDNSAPEIIHAVNS